MTDGDLAAQKARIDEFGWMCEGTYVHTSAGTVDLGVTVYACPRCGGVVTEDWLVVHMDWHESPTSVREP